MAADEEDDASFWERSLDGDGEAFGVLFDRHRSRIFRHASRLVDNALDAEDVVAAAFLELWRRRRSVRLVNGSVLPWLLVTTTNLARNHVRGTLRYRRFLARLPRESPAPDASEVAFGHHTLHGVDHRLRFALQSLRPRDLHLFALVSLEDYSIADAAAALGLTPAAATSRLHRIRRRLREELGPWPDPTPDALGAQGES